MKKILALCLSLCFIFMIIPTASAARDDSYLRIEVGYEGDYYFVPLGQELTIYSILEGASEADKAAFVSQVKYAKESTDYTEEAGFRWIDTKTDGSAEVKWTPTEEGMYCFSAEGVVPSTKKKVSSLDSGMPIVVVIDMENKTVVKNNEEFEQAMLNGATYISIQGDVHLQDQGSVQIRQQTLLEIGREGSLVLSGTELRLGAGRWNVASTIIVDGILQVNEGSSITTGDYPVDAFVSGRIIGWDMANTPKIQYIGCNVSPFEEFTGTYIENKDTGITTVVDNMTNATILNVTKLTEEDALYSALKSMDEGEVVIAFESEITEYDGEYTLSIPVDAKYNGKKVSIYVVDKRIVGYVEPQVSTTQVADGKISITVDSNDIIMIKTYVPKVDTRTNIVVAVLVAAFVVMLAAVLVPLFAGRSRAKKEKDE